MERTELLQDIDVLSIDYMSSPSTTTIILINRIPLTITNVNAVFEQDDSVTNSLFRYISGIYYSIPTINCHEKIGIGNNGLMSFSDIILIETYLYNKWNE